eukprot:1073958-Amphidinium_carterae.1
MCAACVLSPPSSLTTASEKSAAANIRMRARPSVCVRGLKLVASRDEDAIRLRDRIIKVNEVSGNDESMIQETVQRSSIERASKLTSSASRRFLQMSMVQELSLIHI